MKQEREEKYFAPLMDLCHLKNAELERKLTKSEVELYSETTLWKTIQGLTQYSLNMDHQHQKWQQQKSWILFLDCRVAMDNQQTQYRFIPKWKISKQKSYPPQPIPQGMQSSYSGMPSRKKGRQAFGTHMVYRESFCKCYRVIFSTLSARIESPVPMSRSIRPQWRKVKDQNKIEIWDASLDRQPKIQSSSMEKNLQRIMGRPTTTADFWSPLWQIPYASNLCLLE